MFNKKYTIFALVLMVLFVASGCAKNNNQKPDQTNNVQNNKEEQKIEENKNATSTPSDANVNNWQVYKNDQYGFEFKYPNDWYWVDESEKWKEYRKNLGEPERSYLLFVKDAEGEIEGKEYEYVIGVDFGIRKERNAEEYIKSIGLRKERFDGYLREVTSSGYILYKYDDYQDMVNHDERYVECDGLILYFSNHGYKPTTKYVDEIIETINCQ